MVRHKNRFLVVHVTPDKRGHTHALTDRAIHATLQETIRKVFGEKVVEDANSLQVRCTDPATGVCIVRTPRACVRQVCGALAKMTKVGSDRVACRVAHTAGSTRTLRQPAVAVVRTILAASALSDSEKGAADDRFAADLETYFPRAAG